MGINTKVEDIYNMVETAQPATVVDLTAYKLERMLHDASHDEWLHQALLDILGDYYLGLIAIGWENGDPVVLPMADNTWMRGIPPGFSIMAGEYRAAEEHDERDDREDPNDDPDNP